jgi:hypothetical protein
MKRARIAVALLCLLVIAVNLPAAEPLADRLPSGTLVYLGLAGKNKAFDDSMMGKLAQEPGLGKMFDMLRVAVAAQSGAKEMVDGVWDLTMTALRHPAAIALVSFEAGPGGNGPPEVTGAFLIDLGADRKDFAAKLDALIAKAGAKLEDASDGDLKFRQLPTPAGPLATGYLGDTFFLCLGKDMPKRLAEMTPAKSLASDKNFTDAMKAVAGANLQFAFYADTAALMKKAQAMIEPDGAPAGGRGPGFSQVVQSLGVANVKSISAAVCVDGGYLHTKVRLATPAPHRGVLFPLAGDPLTDADLAALPEDTDLLLAGKVSAEGLYDEVRRIIKELSPETDAEITRGMLNPKGIFGGLAIKDVLGSLGQTWTFSCADSYGGLLSGMLLTAEVKDANRLAGAVARLEALLKPAAKPSDNEEPDGFHFPRPAPAVRVVTSGGVEVHYVSFSGMPLPVAPAWAIYKGRLYVAAWPQIILSAIDNQSKGSLANNAGFKELRAKMGGNPSILSYINTPRALRMGYGVPLALWTMGSGMIPSQATQPALPDWLPPLSVLEKYVRPDMGAVSSDKDGITIESCGSIPLFSVAPVMPALGVAVLMPGLSRARSLARGASSKANLSAIGKGIAIWSAANKDQFPPDLAALVEDGQSPSILVSPLSGRQPPKYDREKKTLTGELDYIYIKLDSSAPSELVCAYERPENSVNGIINVLFADLHVGEMDAQSLNEAIKKTQEYLKKKAEK